jgi:hypothetical protein
LPRDVLFIRDETGTLFPSLKKDCHEHLLAASDEERGNGG